MADPHAIEGASRAVIGRLTGTVVQEEADGTVLLDVAGVGYEVSAPAGAVMKAANNGGLVTLWIHTHVREDALVLFGFASPGDRVVFRTLLGIASVGPKTALSLLSSVSGPDLARAVQTKDTALLKKVPGVGAKTAERLVLELRDKLDIIGVGPSQNPAPALSSGGSRGTLVVDALTRLGFRPAEAERAVAAIGDLAESEPLDKAIREALNVLRR